MKKKTVRRTFGATNLASLRSPTEIDKTKGSSSKAKTIHWDHVVEDDGSMKRVGDDSAKSEKTDHKITSPTPLIDPSSSTT